MVCVLCCLCTALNKEMSCQKKRGFPQEGMMMLFCLVDSKYVGKLYRYLLIIFTKS